MFLSSYKIYVTFSFYILNLLCISHENSEKTQKIKIQIVCSDGFKSKNNTAYFMCNKYYLRNHINVDIPYQNTLSIYKAFDTHIDQKKKLKIRT